MEDRRAYDPLLAGRTAASPDPWLRAKTALAAGRLRDPDASVLIPPLLADPEPSVRRAAAFAAGRLGRRASRPAPRPKALGDADAATAANAAEALGKLGGAEATGALARRSRGARRADVDARRGRARAVPQARGADGRRLSSRRSREESLAPELRRAVVYSLARKPLPEAAPALRAVLRMKREGADEAPRPTRSHGRRGALGILGDEESAADLVASRRAPTSRLPCRR